jgi:Flp pilus assembly pilin Flp
MTGRAKSNLTLAKESVARLVVACQVRFLRAEAGQDVIEYSLMVGLIAVAVAATFPTTLMPNVSTIFSKVGSSFTIAGS